MRLVKSEVDVLHEVLEERMKSLVYLLNSKPNEKPIFRGRRKNDFPAGTVINVKKVEYEMIINDIITVLKQLKSLKI